MTKEEIRKIYLQKRLFMTDDEYSLANEKLCENFFSAVHLSSIKIVHTFLPIEKTKEPNTWLIIDRLKKDAPHVKISVPKINNQTSAMDNFYLEGAEQLQKNMWGIPEPKQGVPTPTEQIDLILVPLLAFDAKGNRVGYGRGFYDKFLASCRKDSIKVGLSFFPPVEKIDNLHSQDLPITAVVTPKEVLTF